MKKKNIISAECRLVALPVYDNITRKGFRLLEYNAIESVDVLEERVVSIFKVEEMIQERNQREQVISRTIQSRVNWLVVSCS